MDADAKAASHANDYRSGIRAAIRGYWSGALDREQFGDNMQGVIDKGLRFAFAEGAATCGITPEDYSEVETDALDDILANEMGYIAGLAGDIKITRANKGPLEPLYVRSEVWINRYLEVVNKAKVMACADQKFEWVLGPTEHCSTCAKLAGLVHRGSQWRNYVMPQEPPNDLLECGGWRCQCRLEPTKKRATTRYPSLP